MPLFNNTTLDASSYNLNRFPLPSDTNSSIDLDEGGGAAPPPPLRRSRRTQNLKPTSSVHNANANHSHDLQSIQLKDASQSQYQYDAQAATPILPPIPSNQSRLSSTNLSYALSAPNPILYQANDNDASTLLSLPEADSNTMRHSHAHSRNSDPPEETFGVSSSDRQVTSQQFENGSNSQAPTSYRSASPYTLPDSIHIQNAPTTSSITQPQTYVTSEMFLTLSNTVQQLQQDLQNFQISSNHQHTTIQRNMTNIDQKLQIHQDTMHQTVANAVVAAMQQFHHTQPLLSSQTTPITPSSPSPVPTTHPVQIPVATTTSTSTIPTSNVNNNINQLNHLSSTIPTQTSTVQSFTHNYIPPTSPIPNLQQQGSEADPITLADLVQMSSTPKCSFPIFQNTKYI